MLKDVDEKTALVRNKFFIFLCLLTGLIIGFIIWNQQNYRNCVGVQDQSCIVRYELADNDAKRIKGLSGRDKLPDERSMLFVFDETEKQCFWMKGMKFNIDIVWIDKDKKVLSLDENIKPNTYPETFCEDEVKYVLEVNAGVVRKLNMSIGTQLTF